MIQREATLPYRYGIFIAGFLCFATPLLASPAGIQLYYGQSGSHDATCECPRIDLNQLTTERPANVRLEVMLRDDQSVQSIRYVDAKTGRRHTAVYQDYRDGLPMQVRFRMETERVVLSEYTYTRWVDAGTPHAKYMYTDPARKGRVRFLAYRGLKGRQVDVFPTDQVSIAFQQTDEGVVRTVSGIPETELAICDKASEKNANCDWRCAFQGTSDDGVHKRYWTCFDLVTARNGPPIAEVLPTGLSEAFSQFGEQIWPRQAKWAVREIQTQQGMISAGRQSFLTEEHILELERNQTMISQLITPATGDGPSELRLAAKGARSPITRIVGSAASLIVQLSDALPDHAPRFYLNGLAVESERIQPDAARSRWTVSSPALFPQWNTLVMVVEAGANQAASLHHISFRVTSELRVIE